MVYLHGIHGIGGKLIAEITTLPIIGKNWYDNKQTSWQQLVEIDSK